MANIDVSKFTMAVVSLAVAVLLVLTVLVPVINDSVGSGGGSGDVLYTNTGNYYYNTVTDSTSTTLSFTIGENEYMELALQMSINGGEAEITELPAWTSEQSFDFTTLPLFTFITSDGKYGVEGIVSVGTEEMDPEYVLKGGLMYFRMIQGSVPELHYMIGDEGEISVTLSNGSVSYVFQTEDVPTQLNGTYLLGIVDGATGDYVLSEQPTVLDSTEFYMADWVGSGSVETGEISGDAVVVLERAMAIGGHGTIADFGTITDLSIYNFGGSNIISAEMETAPAESGDGKILEYLVATDGNEAEYNMPYFIVPVEITEGGGSSISPTLSAMLSLIPLAVVIGLTMGVIPYFIRRS